MTRVKTGYTRHRRHKKILSLTKGYWGARSKLYKTAHEAYLHAGAYAFAGRKLRKRDMRRLWIQRINAALKPYEVSYSRFIHQLKLANVDLDRKTLSQMALEQPESFRQVVEKVIKK